MEALFLHLKHVDDNGNYFDDGYDNTYSGDAEDNQDDLLFEKPVRALRKALKCGNRSGNFVSLEKEET